MLGTSCIDKDVFRGIIWLIVDSMPIFLVMPGIVNDIYEIWYIVLGINVCFAIGCLVKDWYLIRQNNLHKNNWLIQDVKWGDHLGRL